MQERKSVILVAVSGLAVMSLGLLQDGPKVKGPSVAVSGENPFIALSLKAGDKPLTNVSFWRAVYSPVGMGHACYITSDVTGNGPSSDDIRAVFTDSPKLADYLSRQIMAAFDKSYAETPAPLFQATFQMKGDTLTEYREIVRSDKHTIELVWKDFYRPILIEIPVKPFLITTMLIPAKVAEVHVNGIKAVGTVFPRPERTEQGSTGSLAFSETWVK